MSENDKRIGIYVDNIYECYYDDDRGSEILSINSKWTENISKMYKIKNKIKEHEKSIERLNKRLDNLNSEKEKMKSRNIKMGFELRNIVWCDPKNED